MGRHSCCIKQKLRKGLWSPEEDEKLYNYITRFGVGCWSTVPKLAGLQRCGKSCRLRWINYLRPDLKRGMFSQQEEDLIIRLHEVLGNRWAQIAAQLPGRTDNEIKNFWNSCLKKKLLKQGIDPNTHQPVIENEVKEEKSCTEKSSLMHHMPQTNGISHSSSTSSGVINTSYVFGRPTEGSRGQHQVNKPVYDPLFLLDLQANLDPCGYVSSSFLSQCQQSLRPYDQNEFQSFPNNGFNSLPNLTNLDHRSMTDNDFSDHSTASRMSSNDHSSVHMINNMLENSTAAAAISWDSDNKLDSVYQYQFNGIKIEEDVKPNPWQEVQLRPENPGDFSNYPLTSLSAEDFSGANLDHVFNHM